MESKYSIIYGQRCKVYKTFCSNCNAEVWKQKSQLKWKNHFCSKKCQNTFQTTGKEFICKVCNTKLYRQISQQRSSNYFCSRQCAELFRSEELTKSNSLRLGDRHPNYKDGGKSYRKKAFRLYGKQCENPECILKISIPEKMLDVDHIDGNRENNEDGNLQVLCVWCHALKTRMKLKINTRNTLV